MLLADCLRQTTWKHSYIDVIGRFIGRRQIAVGSSGQCVVSQCRTNIIVVWHGNYRDCDCSCIYRFVMHGITENCTVLLDHCWLICVFCNLQDVSEFHSVGKGMQFCSSLLCSLVIHQPLQLLVSCNFSAVEPCFFMHVCALHQAVCCNDSAVILYF